MIKKIFNFFKLSNHKVIDIGTKNQSISYHNNHIIDLDKNWILKEQKAKLISYLGNDKIKENEYYPVIETWTMQNNYTFTINNYFRETQSKKIKEQKNKKIISKEEKVYLLPYYTSHFGHFVGDILGSILFYIEKFKNTDRKILITCPSIKWKNFFENKFKDQIFLINPSDLVKNNYLFNNAIILPRMSTFQNLQIARNFFLSSFDKGNYEEKIFLTSNRKSRISNIDELSSKLKENGFKIINPSKIEIVDLINIIRNCKILICEKASVMNNLLFARDKTFYLLCSKTEKNLKIEYFVGAGIYKTFLSGIIKEIYCDDDPINQNEKPYKKRIRVNSDNLIKNLIK